MKINKGSKLACNVQDKENYSIHILALKQALNHVLKLTKAHNEFIQEEWLKPYIDMNTELRMHAEIEFEEIVFKLINNAVFERQWRM